ncbi:hypothetical protein Tco_0855665 [Tanacetum coccineum]
MYICAMWAAKSELRIHDTCNLSSVGWFVKLLILIDEPFKFYEWVAYYVAAECLVTTVRDGTVRVNPWNIAAVADAMDYA